MGSSNSKQSAQQSYAKAQQSQLSTAANLVNNTMPPPRQRKGSVGNTLRRAEGARSVDEFDQEAIEKMGVAKNHFNDENSYQKHINKSSSKTGNSKNRSGSRQGSIGSGGPNQPLSKRTLSETDMEEVTQLYWEKDMEYSLKVAKAKESMNARQLKELNWVGLGN